MSNHRDIGTTVERGREFWRGVAWIFHGRRRAESVAQISNLLYRRFLIGKVSGALVTLCTASGLETGDTAQRGGAAKGARVCDSRELCRRRSVLTNAARRALSTCCGSQSRGPE